MLIQPQVSNDSEIRVGSPPSTGIFLPRYLPPSRLEYASHLPSGEHMAGLSSGPLVSCFRFPPVESMRQMPMALDASCAAPENKMERPGSQEMGAKAG